MRIPTLADLRLMPAAVAIQHIQDVEALVDRVFALKLDRDALSRIRARITTLTLVANLPPSVWSELCHLDSELSVLLKGK